MPPGALQFIAHLAAHPDMQSRAGEAGGNEFFMQFGGNFSGRKSRLVHALCRRVNIYKSTQLRGNSSRSSASYCPIGHQTMRPVAYWPEASTDITKAQIGKLPQGTNSQSHQQINQLLQLRLQLN